MTVVASQVKEEIVINARKDYGQFYHILNQEFKYTNVKIKYNLKFVEPFDILILTQFIILSKIRGCDIHFVVKEVSILNYFKDIGLSSFCNENYKQASTIKSIPSRTAMPIRRVRLENIDEYINYTYNYLESICDGKDLSMLNNCLAELINNVYDHSNSIIDAYVFSQFYPKNNKIKIAVADFGVGIPFSVTQYLKKIENPILDKFEAVNWALGLRNTVKSTPRNRGFGLATIDDFVKGNEGALIIRTEDVKLFGINKQNFISSNDIIGFKGTSIEITIDVANLDKKEEIDWNWTDF